MAAPGFFMLLALILLALFVACLAGGVALIVFGRRENMPVAQFSSALPLGLGLLVIGPLLLITVAMVVWWFSADWQGIPAGGEGRTLESRGVTFLVPIENGSTMHGDFGFKFNGKSVHAETRGDTLVVDGQSYGTVESGDTVDLTVAGHVLVNGLARIPVVAEPKAAHEPPSTATSSEDSENEPIKLLSRPAAEHGGR